MTVLEGAKAYVLVKYDVEKRKAARATAEVLMVH